MCWKMRNWSLLGTFLKLQDMHVYTYEMFIPINLSYWTVYKVKMNKTLKEVTKNPNRKDTACKGREKYINKFKESILNNEKKYWLY